MTLFSLPSRNTEVVDFTNLRRSSTARVKRASWTYERYTLRKIIPPIITAERTFPTMRETLEMVRNCYERGLPHRRSKSMAYS